ncbi:IS630 family transposase, partial [Methylobacterium sp. J-078]|nr:IS630 family transposase [Methylobacterium sp. J-078]
NQDSQNTPRLLAGLAGHPCWSFHWTPTSASWLNAVEGFSSALTRRRIQRGTSTGVVDLQVAINRYIPEHTRSPKPFIWTKPASAIFDALSRAPEPSV